jgi:hypothetical protein
MDHNRPSGSPPCWGRKYQDGAEECMQCYYNEGCRQEMLYQVARPNQPAVRNYAPPIQPPRLALPTPSATVVPLPPKPYFAPPVSSIPVPTRTIPVPTVPTPPTTSQTYYQQSTGHSLPNPGVNNPMAHWQRPGAPAQPYYFIQYPGESTGTRLVKNAVLRALEAIFAELMQFFRHWTWPPGKV